MILSHPTNMTWSKLSDWLMHISRYIFEWIFGVTPRVDLPSNTFIYDTLNVTIDSSCSGAAFWWYTCILLLVFFHKHMKCWSIIAVPIGSFFIAVLGNSIRLVVSVYAQELGDLVLPKGPHWGIHEAMSYLVFGSIWLGLFYWRTQLDLKQKIAPGGAAAAPMQDGRVETRQAKRPQEALKGAVFHRPDQWDYSGAPEKAPKSIN